MSRRDLTRSAREIRPRSAQTTRATTTLRRVTYGCAFCGEENEVFVDLSGGRRQTFTEDCTVCCQPNLIALTIDDDGEVELQVTQE